MKLKWNNSINVYVMRPFQTVPALEKMSLFLPGTLQQQSNKVQVSGLYVPHNCESDISFMYYALVF